MIQTAPLYPPSTSKAVAQIAPEPRARPGDAGDRTTPKFARHRAHVRAVLAAGGFPVLARR